VIIPQAQLRDYILRELSHHQEGRGLLEKQLQELVMHPARYPDMFVWYFQKLVGDDEENAIPFQNQEGRNQFFESFFILFSVLENQPEYRELLKKMYGMLSGKRYALVRKLLQGTSVEFAKEFLLLASKCQTLTGHDMKILQSLTEVVHPSLAQPKQRKGAKADEQEEIWTTEEGYLKVQERIRHIGTVEMVENAREIEAARALGDLRENSEFKFAQERRARLQSELKTLSSMLRRARIITPADIHTEEVGIGNVVSIVNSKGQEATYTILGPWDVDPDRNILSLNSKLAQAMLSKKVGESFHFRDEDFQIANLGSYFNQ
jgi:transcription elongation factor GreA